VRAIKTDPALLLPYGARIVLRKRFPRTSQCSQQRHFHAQKSFVVRRDSTPSQLCQFRAILRAANMPTTLESGSDVAEKFLIPFAVHHPAEIAANLGGLGGTVAPRDPGTRRVRFGSDDGELLPSACGIYASHESKFGNANAFARQRFGASGLVSTVHSVARWKDVHLVRERGDRREHDARYD
jgi:hypothetical protein